MADISTEDIQIILRHPFGAALEPIRQSFRSACDKLGLTNSSERIKNVVSSNDGRSLTRQLIGRLILHDAAIKLPSKISEKSLSDDVAATYIQLGESGFDITQIIPLCTLVINKASDEAIWKAVFDIIANTQTKPTLPPPLTTPPPSHRNSIPSIKETPSSYNSGYFQNTSEPVDKVRDILRWELNSSLELDHSDFVSTFLEDIPHVDDAATAVFKMCQQGKEPWYKPDVGWCKWDGRNEKGIQQSLEEHISAFTRFLSKVAIKPPSQRQFVPSPNNPLQGPVQRKPDICLAATDGKDTGHVTNDHGWLPSWRQVLVPFELKALGQDGLEKTWLDITKYVRQILRHQDSRRFVLGVTLSGPIMRLWEFDRLGATTSVKIDIQQEGLLFVKILLSFLYMDNKQLGFDPDLMEVDGYRFVKINRDGKEERLVITNTLRDHAACIAGRATTCWTAYQEGDDSKTLLVVKDSWQFVERPEEGNLIRKASNMGVTNISQYYHHETVRFHGAEDKIRSNVRKGMSTDGGYNPLLEEASLSGQTTGSSLLSGFSKSRIPSQGSSLAKKVRPSPPSVFSDLTSLRRSPRLLEITGHGRVASTASQGSQIPRKRSSSQIDVLEPPQKRSRSIMISREGKNPSKDRVRRRVVTRNFGKPLRQASCPAAIITGILGGIKGHECLYNAGILHRDISIGNILLEEDESDGFLIDLDLAIQINREAASGALGNTGTKAFMAIGALDGDPHTFMHDLESFFWVIFWICVHYTGPGKEQQDIGNFKDWNYESTEKLGELKSALVMPKYFKAKLEKYATDYCRPIIPLIIELWQEVFPGGQSYDYEDKTLSSRMKAVLKKYQRELGSLSIYTKCLSMLDMNDEARFNVLDRLKLTPTTRLTPSSMQGTKAFMAIGALCGDPHSFMHDLESFFWVIFWICVHYTGPGKEQQDIGNFKDWNYESTEKLAMSKLGLVSQIFFKAKLEKYATDYCRPIIPLIIELWQEVFPGGQIYDYEDKTLYSRMKAELEKARDRLQQVESSAVLLSSI